MFFGKVFMYKDYFSKNMPICLCSFWQVLNDTFIFIKKKKRRNENQWIQPHSNLLVFENFMTYGNWFHVDLDLSTKQSVVYHWIGWINV